MGDKMFNRKKIITLAWKIKQLESEWYGLNKRILDLEVEKLWNLEYEKNKSVCVCKSKEKTCKE